MTDSSASPLTWKSVFPHSHSSTEEDEPTAQSPQQPSPAPLVPHTAPPLTRAVLTAAFHGWHAGGVRTGGSWPARCGRRSGESISYQVGGLISGFSPSLWRGSAHQGAALLWVRCCTLGCVKQLRITGLTREDDPPPGRSLNQHVNIC